MAIRLAPTASSSGLKEPVILFAPDTLRGRPATLENPGPFRPPTATPPNPPTPRPLAAVGLSLGQQPAGAPRHRAQSFSTAVRRSPPAASPTPLNPEAELRYHLPDAGKSNTCCSPASTGARRRAGQCLWMLPGRGLHRFPILCDMRHIESRLAHSSHLSRDVRTRAGRSR